MVTNNNLKVWEFRLMIRGTAATGGNKYLIAFTTHRKKYYVGAKTEVIKSVGLLHLLGQFVRKDRKMCAKKAGKQNQE